MIFVNRSAIPVPAVFESDEIRVAKRRMEGFYGRSPESRSQEKYSTPLEKELRNRFLGELRSLFNHKCAYCESVIIASTAHSEYDHFRPRNGARGLEKEFSNEHYWWLTYEWNNLYYCCEVCNQYKSTWFPVTGERARIASPYEEMVDIEQPL